VGGVVGALRMRFPSELRTRWRSWLGLALLIGLVGGAAVAAAVGARRTETAYPRFVQAQNGYALMTGGFPGGVDPARALAKMEALPEVAQWARVDLMASAAVLPSGRVAPAPELKAVTDLRAGGFPAHRFKVISGRMVNLRAPGEAMIDFLPPTVRACGWVASSGSSSAARTPSARGRAPFALSGSWPLPGSSRPWGRRRPLAAST